MASTLASFLQQKRKNSGLSQRQVSAKLGYSTPQFISNWERGVSRPPIPTIKKLGALYGVDPKDLFDVVLNSEIEDVKKSLEAKFRMSRAA